MSSCGSGGRNEGVGGVAGVEACYVHPRAPQIRTIKSISGIPLGFDSPVKIGGRTGGAAMARRNVRGAASKPGRYRDTRALENRKQHANI